jgi:hypothetical protein
MSICDYLANETVAYLLNEEILDYMYLYISESLVLNVLEQ